MIRKATFGLAVMMALALALPLAAVQAVTVNDSEEPGSVVVFPLFEKGTVMTADQGVLPRSSFEISVVCPPGATCSDGDDVDIKAHWVCGGSDKNPFAPCLETDFTINTTVNGTVRFNPNTSICSPGPGFQNLEGCGSIQLPPCQNGYLIAWVVNESGQNIRFDGLLGDAVIRESSGAATAYNAIPIQAAEVVWTPDDITAGEPLQFNGSYYKRVTGKIYASARYDVINSSHVDQDRTELILLTLDTLSNRPNFPTYVDLNFYNEVEQVKSATTHFTCWGRTGNFNTAFGLNNTFGTKGLVESTRAQKVPLAGINDWGGPVTLLGLLTTREFNPAGTALLRQYIYPLLNDSKGVSTTFVP
jgi:hypothetical protein